MRGVWAIAGHELRQTMADRGAVLWLFVLPIVFAAFIGMVIGGQTSPSAYQASLMVVDEDGGDIARQLVDALASEKLSVTELEAGEVESAEKVRTLWIPKGMTEKARRGEQVTLRLVKEPDTSGEAALLAEARITAAIARVVGELVAGELEQESAEDPVPGQGVESRPEVSPEDLVRVESRFAGTATVVPSGFSQSIPGNAVMFVMLVALTFGAATLTAEREGGQLRRLGTAPVAHGEIILGKVLGRFVVSGVQIVVLVGVALLGHALFDIPVGDDPLALLVILLVYAAGIAPLGVLFGALFTDPDRAANIGVLATLAMAAFGGCWWPIEVVSPTLQKVALALPTGWAMHALHQVISFGHGLGAVTTSLAVLLVFGVVCTAVAARVLRITR
jgi:ABC-type multidrug transport system permease subunit